MLIGAREAVEGVTEEQLEKLKKLALGARELSYSPYSEFRVGCCLLTSSLEFVSGANVENASYGGAICAERTAIVKAVTSENSRRRDQNKQQWLCMAIAGDSLESCISPCGICRQVIREFAPDSFPIVMLNGDGSRCVIKTLEELLPMSFGPDDISQMAA